MTREQLLKKLDDAWRELTASYEGIPSSRMIEPGVVGDWSVKDLLGHITTWEEESLTHLPAILESRRIPTYSQLHGSLDRFNAKSFEEKRAVPLREILSRLNETHQRLLDFVEHAPEEQIAHETRFRRRLRLDTYSHYPEHARAIQAWRHRNSL